MTSNSRRPGGLSDAPSDLSDSNTVGTEQVDFGPPADLWDDDSTVSEHAAMPGGKAGAGGSREDEGDIDNRDATDGSSEHIAPEDRPPDAMSESTGTNSEDESETEYERFQRAQKEGAAAAHGDGGRPRRTKRSPRRLIEEHANMLVSTVFNDMTPEAVFAFMMADDGHDMITFVTEQMTASKGLRRFGQR